MACSSLTNMGRRERRAIERMTDGRRPDTVADPIRSWFLGFPRDSIGIEHPAGNVAWYSWIRWVGFAVLGLLTTRMWRKRRPR